MRATQALLALLDGAEGFGLAPSCSPRSRAPSRPRRNGRDAIRALVGEAPLEPGKVRLELPSIVENGNTVPLTVRSTAR